MEPVGQRLLNKIVQKPLWRSTVNLHFYCNAIRDLVDVLEITYEPKEWMLKAVLLKIWNTMPSVPVDHSTILRETYRNLIFILDRIIYKEHEWLICAD